MCLAFGNPLTNLEPCQLLARGDCVNASTLVSANPFIAQTQTTIPSQNSLTPVWRRQLHPYCVIHLCFSSVLSVFVIKSANQTRFARLNDDVHPFSKLVLVYGERNKNYVTCRLCTVDSGVLGETFYLKKQKMCLKTRICRIGDKSEFGDVWDLGGPPTAAATAAT